MRCGRCTKIFSITDTRGKVYDFSDEPCIGCMYEKRALYPFGDLVTKLTTKWNLNPKGEQRELLHMMR